jgi:hypothetical protein
MRSTSRPSVGRPSIGSKPLSQAKAKRRFLVALDDASELLAQRAVILATSPGKISASADSLEALLAATAAALPAPRQAELQSAGARLLAAEGERSGARDRSSGLSLLSSADAYTQAFGTASRGTAGGEGGGSSSAAVGFAKLIFSVEAIDCRKETVLETGRDEIAIAGTLLDPRQKISSYSRDLGTFGKGDYKRPQAALSTQTLSLTGAGTYVATVALAERDSKNLETFLSKLGAKVTSIVREKLSDTFDEDEESWVEILIEALTIVFDAIISIFSGQTLGIEIMEIQVLSGSGGFGSGDAEEDTTQKFAGWGADYRVRFRWKLTH